MIETVARVISLFIYIIIVVALIGDIIQVNIPELFYRVVTIPIERERIIQEYYQVFRGLQIFLLILLLFDGAINYYYGSRYQEYPRRLGLVISSILFFISMIMFTFFVTATYFLIMFFSLFSIFAFSRES